MASEYILDVSETDFEFEVLAFSQKTPVVVDFWATWCAPCKVIEPILERLAEEAHGGFRLARVNADDNPNLAIRYGVSSLPTVKAFHRGQVASEFVGAQPEQRIRDFIRGLAPSPNDLELEKAKSLYSQHQWASAEQAYRHVIEQTPNQPAALLGLAKCLIAQGRGEEAIPLLRDFPASREYVTAQGLQPLIDALIGLQQNRISGDDTLVAAYHNSLRLIKRGNFPSALDGLLDILHQDKHFQNDKARLVYLAVLELMGENDPQTRQYRSELASALF